MILYVDTSVLFAVLDRDDFNHARAKALWSDLIEKDAVLFCSNYVAVECCALVQRRLGKQALRVFLEDMMPMLSVHWIEQGMHQSAVEMLLDTDKRGPSLVDCTSFGVMRHIGTHRAFVFDKHFAQEGFECVETV